MTITLTTTGTRLLDSAELKHFGLINSRTSLHRYLHRELNQNPFPTPMRHTVTGRRYWLESEVALWKQREDRRKRVDLDDPNLVLDADPKAWMPKEGRLRDSAVAGALNGGVAHLSSS